MARIRLEIDETAYERLIKAAAEERRPPDWHAEYLLLRALGVEPGGRQDNITPLRLSAVTHE